MTERSEVLRVLALRTLVALRPSRRVSAERRMGFSRDYMPLLSQQSEGKNRWVNPGASVKLDSREMFIQVRQCHSSH